METPGMDNQRQVTLAYLAGLIDGEGTIRINKAIIPKYRHVPLYQAQISCGMTARHALDVLVQTFGGTIRIEESRSGCKPVYRWALSGNVSARNAIWLLYPYLRVKRQQAAVTLDFIFNWKSPRIRRAGVDPSELQRREDLYMEVRKLNAVGTAATTKCESVRENEAIV